MSNGWYVTESAQQGRIPLHRELLLTTLQPSLCQTRFRPRRHRSEVAGEQLMLRGIVRLVGSEALFRWYKYAKLGLLKPVEMWDNCEE
jgi:hypothetical protein